MKLALCHTQYRQEWLSLLWCFFSVRVQVTPPTNFICLCHALCWLLEEISPLVHLTRTQWVQNLRVKCIPPFHPHLNKIKLKFCLEFLISCRCYLWRCIFVELPIVHSKVQLRAWLSVCTLCILTTINYAHSLMFIRYQWFHSIIFLSLTMSDKNKFHHVTFLSTTLFCAKTLKDF